ncbi:hypothetical protein V498_06899 [Pseudogymnoascus sp. VKM F-4517 (FW-2822)]|nr:hypothetical protein V498_06899 [Pseudogymnoascus sp. VKM F-4517 (FW-2822)]
MSSTLYCQTLHPLEADFTVVYFEPRGNGRSSRPVSQKEMSTTVQVNDLEYLRLHLGLLSMAVLGHSSDGAIALGYAECFPAYVSKLVLVDHSLQDFSTDSFQHIATIRRNHPIYGPALQALKDLMTKLPETDEEVSKGLIQALPYYFADTSKTHIVMENLWSLVSAWAFNAHRIYDEESPFSHVAGLHLVTADTLVLCGREDGICSVASTERTDEGIERCRLEVVEDAGHFPWVEKPNDFFPILVKFLKGE